jgi:hypothetical protein
MRARREMRAHRALTACALAIVASGGIVVAARPSGTGSHASEVALEPAAAQPIGCHVTHPNGRTAPGETPSGTFYGKRGLWTLLPLDGVLRITTTSPAPAGETGGQIHPDGSLSTKFPWWGSRSAAAKLTVRGRRLDGQARRLRLAVGPGATARSPHFWPTMPRFAKAGCWRVTARSGRARLTFTIFVRRAAVTRAG